MTDIDDYDRKILMALQRDASRPVDTLADEIGLSRNATWRRMRRLEALALPIDEGSTSFSNSRRPLR